MFLLCNITVQGISLFMPTLLAGMGYSKIQSQLLTVPPYIVSSIWSIGIAYACQKTGKRALWTLVTTPLSILGSAMLIGSKDRKVEYAGIFFLAMGSTCSILRLRLEHSIDSHSIPSGADLPCVGQQQLCSVHHSCRQQCDDCRYWLPGANHFCLDLLAKRQVRIVRPYFAEG